MTNFVDFDAIKAKYPIMDVVALLGIQTKPEPGSIKFRGECPFCHEKRSFVVTTDAGKDHRGMAGCFKCGPKGDAIGLVARILNVKANQAALYIEEQLGERKSTVPGNSTVSRERNSTVSAEPAAPLEKVAARLEHEHPDVQALGIDADTAASLGIGYDKRGILRGRVLIPLYRDGQLVGFAGFAEGKVPVLKFPPNVGEVPVVESPNVVRFPKKAG